MTRSWASVSLRLGGRAWVICHTYPDGGPILAVSADESSLSITPHDRARIVDRDVTLARDLVAATRTYLAECERLRVADTDPDSGEAA